MLIAAMTMTLVIGCEKKNEAEGKEETTKSEITDSEPSDAENAQIEEMLLKKLNYDVEEMPNGWKSVVYLSGSWHDIGEQYAKLTPDAVKCYAATGLSAVISSYGMEEAKEMSQEYIAYYKEHAPELVELYQGMADGIGMEFDDFVLAYINFYADEAATAEDVERDDTDGCSNIAAWGEATKDGTLIIGADWDSLGVDSYYEPTVVVYPENGNAFINGSGFEGNLAMNIKGLACSGSSGQSAGEGDNAIGLPVMTSTFLSAAKYDNAEEAQKNYLEHYTAIYAENANYNDTNGGHILTEASAAHHASRTSGDFGEKDYLIATNDFMTDEMQSSMLPEGSGYDDCRPRYWTEEKVLLDAKGEATVQTIADAIGATGFYADGKWTEDNWNLDIGLNSPEAISPFYQNLLKSIAVPETGAFYVMNGCSNTEISLLPGASGSYVKLTLAEDMWTVNTDARSTANLLIYDAGNYITHMSGNTEKQKEDLNTAKQALVAGDSYTSQAGCAENEDTARELLSKATSQYMKAQTYAQKAQDDVTAVLNY